jgi:Polyketide cyclase / dehydrase and lipid transport.
LFDVAKPITDDSHLEIEKATLYGRPYRTGGGRTIDANSIDILFTWLINHDREFLQGGATGATQPGMTVFPYFASPNREVQSVEQSVELTAAPDAVWSLIGQFSLDWHPLVASVTLTGSGIGQLRTLRTLDGGEVIERLEAVDNVQRFYRYSKVAGFPATRYAGTIEVRPKGSGSIASWRVEFLANNLPDIAVRGRVSGLVKTGLGSLNRRFGVAA